MTQEEKAKAHDEALKKLHEIITMDNHPVLPKEIGEFLFPELAENEDERIRKGLIHHLKELREWKAGTMSPIKVKEHYDVWIDYLEKQKEQNHDGKKWIREKDYKEQLDAQYAQGLEDGRKEQNIYKSSKSEIDFADRYSKDVWEKLMSKFKEVEGYRIGCNDMSDIVLNAILNAFKWQKEQKSAEWRPISECGDIPDGHYVVGAFRFGDFRLGIMCNGVFVEPNGNRAEQPKEVFYIPNLTRN